MFYWIGFFLVEFILLKLYSYNRSFVDTPFFNKINSEYPQKKNKAATFFLFVAILNIIYFVSFRDGLGTDYTGYQGYCERKLLDSLSFWLAEPLPKLVYNYCYETSFSAVLFFGISAIIIYGVSFHVYSKYREFVFIVLLFLLYSDIFLSSLNLVRQFTAAAVFLLGVHLSIEEKHLNRYILLATILICFLIHKSSIVLIPIIFLSTNKYSPTIIAILLLSSMFLPIAKLIESGYVGQLLTLLDYDAYLSYNTHSVSRFSFLNIFMHICFIPFLVYQDRVNKIKDNRLIFSIKMYALYLICNNLSANSLPIFYRLAPYFVLFIPIVLSYLPRILKNNLIKVLLLIPLTFILFYILYNKKDDRVYVPTKILPLNSIYDENYFPYQNPDTYIVQ